MKIVVPEWYRRLDLESAELKEPLGQIIQTELRRRQVLSPFGPGLFQSSRWRTLQGESENKYIDRPK